MAISFNRTDRERDRKRLLSCLMVAVYLLVVHYALSHVHTVPDDNFQQEVSWQQPIASDDDDERDNRNTHHSSACMLVSQASSLVHWLKIKEPIGAVVNQLLINDAAYYSLIPPPQ